jgi:cysteinyl-tRNA synthetase
VHDWGEPEKVDLGYVNRFKEQINEDLNMPRALAVVWELVKDGLPPSTKKATLLQFDRVLGLRLADWQPKEAAIPPEIMAIVEEREKARSEKRWKDADGLREQVRQAGYKIEDTAKGPKIKAAGQERS